MSQLKKKRIRQQNKYHMKQKKRERKKRVMQIIQNTLISSLIVGLIITIFTGIVDAYINKLNQAVQHNKEAYESVYLPVSTELLSADKPIYLENYISVMRKHIAGKEHLVDPQVLIKLRQLIDKYNVYVVANDLTVISDQVKNTKKIELLVAAREYEARFNEQFQTVSEIYYSNINISTNKQINNLLVAKLKFREESIFQFTTEIR